MEEKILKILKDNNDEILDYKGENLLDDGIIDSFNMIGIIGDLEEEFDIEIDAKYMLEKYFRNVDSIIEMVKTVLSEIS